MEGESAEAYQARLSALRAEEAARLQALIVEYQRRWWNESESVLLARVERTDSARMYDIYGASIGSFPRAHLRPVRWLKGAGPSRRFRLTYTGMTSCGPYGGGDAVAGAVGDVFVVFVRSGRPSQRTVIESVALANIRDPQLRERVDAVQ